MGPDPKSHGGTHHVRAARLPRRASSREGVLRDRIVQKVTYDLYRPVELVEAVQVNEDFIVYHQDGIDYGAPNDWILRSKDGNLTVVPNYFFQAHYELFAMGRPQGAEV